uniref:Uncharacterized protein n=1 Tax=Romanomermis culicivorax TaxID=13658 RepID=A0A915JLU3_ROMCU
IHRKNFGTHCEEIKIDSQNILVCEQSIVYFLVYSQLSDFQLSELPNDQIHNWVIPNEQYRMQ